MVNFRNKFTFFMLVNEIFDNEFLGFQVLDSTLF
jgi:hypothetical protein